MESDAFNAMFHPVHVPSSPPTPEPMDNQPQIPRLPHEEILESIGVEAKFLSEPIEDEEWYWVWA